LDEVAMPLVESDVESPDHCPWAELEAVFDNLVNLITNIVHAFLYKVEF
jgi:hypothetical protein